MRVRTEAQIKSVFCRLTNLDMIGATAYYGRFDAGA